MNAIIICNHFNNFVKNVILETINITNYARKKFSRRAGSNKKSHPK